ncbi:MAG: TonB-dependent receptor [Gammaproteobacteria bacterium]|nr:TonB-dependent receptor [Gammaproteobacteria bacterium]
MCFSVVSFAALAEPDANNLPGSESDFLDELPVVLSATRLSQPLDEAPMAITVIDREMIDASGARTVPDLLRMVPGFQVGYFDGNSPVATYHGHGDEYSRRVQVLIDGRSVYVPTLAGIQWSDHIISIDDIARIEVTRGPNAASYGNNSFLAVVSITTRQAIEDQGHKVKIIKGSYNTREGYYRYGEKLGNADFRITLGTEHDDGTELLNDYTRADYISYRLDNQIDLYNFFSYQGGYKDIKLGDHESPPDYQIETISAFQWLKWEHTTSNNNILSLQYYYNHLEEDLGHENQSILLSDIVSTSDKDYICITRLGLPDNTCLDNIDPYRNPDISLKSKRHDFEFSYTFNYNNFRLVTGSSARMDIIQANNVFSNNNTLRHKLYRGFAHGEFRQNNWLFNAGFMIEKNDISGTDYSPRLSIIQRINNNNTIRISTSKATRTPTLYDQNAHYATTVRLTENNGLTLSTPLQLFLGGDGTTTTDIMHNVHVVSLGNIKSEEISSLEIGYISRLLDNKLTMDIKLFSDNTDNLIGSSDSNFPALIPQDNVGGTATEILNTHKTEIQGAEISLDYKLPRNYRIYTHFSYIDITAEMFEPRGTWRDTRRYSVSAPEKTLGFTFIKHWPQDFNASINYYRVSDMDWMDRTGSTTPVSVTDRSAQPYNKLDLKLNKQYRFGNEKLDISLSLLNLLEDYFDYNRTRYTDNTFTTVAPNSNTLNSNGSLQDLRAYLEISLEFN